MARVPVYSGRRLSGATDPVVVAMLAGILVVLTAIAAIMLLRDGSTGDKDGGGKGAGGPAAAAKPPPKPADTGRIVQMYRTGVPYRSVVRASLNGRATHKDWGVVTAMAMHFVGESEVVRQFESNDGSTLRLIQDVRRARCLTAFTKIEGLRIELPWTAQLVLDGAGWLVGAEPGWTITAVPVLNSVLNHPSFLGFVNDLRQDPGAQVKRYLDGLEGKKARLVYVNGQGVKSIEPLGCVLSGDERAFFEASSVISDAHIFPDIRSKPGDTWTIDGADLQSFMDPTLRATFSGKLTARRGPDRGTGDDLSAEIILDRGVLDVHSADDTTETTAQWAPRGTLVYSFKDGIITKADLSGRFRIVKRSTDHIIFEARYTVEPEYRIAYVCEVGR